MEYFGFGWDNFDFLYYDVVQLNYKNNWVVGGLGYIVYQVCVIGDFRLLYQGLGRVIFFGGFIFVQINRYNYFFYNDVIK